MRKLQQSIRLKPEHRRALKREVVRLTLNPVVVGLSEAVVDWSGADHRRLHPSDVVFRARARFPALPLSWAVEGYVVLLLMGDAQKIAPWPVTPLPKLPPAARRFARLSLTEKTRAVERWKKTLRRLRRTG